MATLNDTEIRTEIKAERLLHGADPSHLAGACYELRMGSVYYDLTEGAKRIELNNGETALIKPGHRVVLITLEKLNIPTDILVRVVSKGSLFSIGLSPVATYADPGFSGNLGIVTENVSDKYIELPQGEPIAKADFTRLSGSAEKVYQGQHGFQTGIWPIKTQLQKSYSDVKDDPRVLSERTEALALLPDATRTIIRQIEKTQAWINFALVAAIILNTATIIAANTQWIDNIIAIIINLFTSAITALGVILINYFRKI